MTNDLRHSLRQLIKAPSFTAIALLTLAIGIGACTAMFSVVNSVLLRPIAYPQSEELVIIRESYPPEYPVFSVSPPNFHDWETQNTVFTGMYAQRNSNLNLTGHGEPSRVFALHITGHYFEVLRTQPMLGRVIGPVDVQPDSPPVVVLSYGFWRKTMGGRNDVVGETLRLNGRMHTIIGVMPPTFQKGYPFEIITPLVFTDKELANDNRGSHYIYVGARMKPGVTVDQAQAEMSALAARLAKQYPDSNKGWGAVVTTVLDNNTAAIKPTLYALLAAVGVLLLIACANVANLQLARATARQREMSIRAALGASRWRVIRQLFTENVVLALVGGGFGVLAGKWLLDALVALAPNDLPRAAEITLDGRVLAVTLVVSILTGLGFGLAPAWQAARVDLVDAIKEGARGASDSGRRHFVRHGLVVIELALAVVLLTSAGLLVRSFTRLSAFNPGFEPRGSIMVGITLPVTKYATPESQIAFADAVLQRFQAIPGVTAAGATHVMPMASSGWVLGLEIEGRNVPASELPNINYYSVSADFLKAAHVPLVRGRYFTGQDRAGSAAVAIISQSAADKFFPGTDPIGKRIYPTNGPHVLCEIVGIVGEMKQYGADMDSAPQIYVPFAQVPFPEVNFLVRTNDTAADAGRRVEALGPILRQEVYAVDAEQPVARLEPFENLMKAAMARQRFATTLFITFSGLALILAVIGIYGVMAYAVSQRTGEFGIRIALGAQPIDILRLVLANGARLVGLGLLVGLVAALLTGRYLESMLYQTPARDPLVFVAIALLLAATAIVACLLPAHRATKVDPMVALRAE